MITSCRFMASAQLLVQHSTVLMTCSIWTTGTRSEVARAPSEVGFFASSAAGCPHKLQEGGCISNSTPTYGAAIRSLPDSHGIYLPMSLQIIGWDDGTNSFEEPRDGQVLGEYMLDLTAAGSKLGPGDWFTIFGFDMMKGGAISSVISSGSQPANQPSLLALRSLCKAAGGDCRSCSRRMTEGGSGHFKGAAKCLGKLPANSVTFFIAVKGK